jgi:NifU-like protein involved in Fe-S cluster formation
MRPFPPLHDIHAVHAYVHTSPFRVDQLSCTIPYQHHKVHPSCGDAISFGITLEQGHIVQCCFSATGCLLSQLAAATIAAHMTALSVHDARQSTLHTIFGPYALLDTLGPTRLWCVQTPFETVQELIATIPHDPTP